MRSVWLIFQREFQAYWTSPVAYVVLAMFLILSGFFFFGEFSRFVDFSQRGGSGVDVNQMLIRPYFYTVSVMILFLLPLVTMRLFAEERRQGTLEVLLTTPATEFSLVLGKFFAALGLFAVMMLGSVVHIGLLFIFGSPDLAPVLTGFLGLFLTGAVYIAIGVLLSSLTQNQVVAAAISFSLFLALWLFYWIGGLTSGSLSKVLLYTSLAGHFENFGRGVLSSSDFVFYLSWIVAGLFGATQVVQSTRWKA
ncbi:MAG: ABC transporter permease subunit [Candidatus Eisenbacteria bacterium]|uniref:ABC transporter permease subunit n=1 Tax=Eiseniibacteriota bacterium TaxID=2212470 RepID=A0A7Y2H242_UNCEI|nr:ABC transporter permease subunit [Candidatus Eisenbacteria bacterium]